jgi:ribonuclease H / adenosylcobalamin/alpha-ribazole phosphatase
MQYVVVEADGGSRGNPGPAGYGAAVFDPDSGAVLAERSEAIGTETNNVAEYRGLIAGLSAAAELGARHVRVRMDSKLVVEQMSGRWQVKNTALRDLARAALALCQQFDEVSFEWVPRDKNKHADRLANEAMDRAAGIPARVPRTSARATAAATSSPSWGAPPTRQHTRLFLVRHGSTEHSAARRFSGRNELPLNEVGSQQAARLAASPFGEVAAVVSSPLRRAVQTADAIAAPRGLAVKVDADLVETDFGGWEGMTLAEAFEADRELVRKWHDSPDVAPPGGESFTAVEQRVERARARLVADHPDSTVVVVTHVTPIKLLVCNALQAPTVALFRLHLDTASVSVVDYYADGNVSVRLVNDTSHLR